MQIALYFHTRKMCVVFIVLFEQNDFSRAISTEGEHPVEVLCRGRGIYPEVSAQGRGRMFLFGTNRSVSLEGDGFKSYPFS